MKRFYYVLWVPLCIVTAMIASACWTLAIQNADVLIGALAVIVTIACVLQIFVAIVWDDIAEDILKDLRRASWNVFGHDIVKTLYEDIMNQE